MSFDWREAGGGQDPLSKMTDAAALSLVREEDDVITKACVGWDNPA